MTAPAAPASTRSGSRSTPASPSSSALQRARPLGQLANATPLAPRGAGVVCLDRLASDARRQLAWLIVLFWTLCSANRPFVWLYQLWPFSALRHAHRWNTMAPFFAGCFAAAGVERLRRPEGWDRTVLTVAARRRSACESASHQRLRVLARRGRGPWLRRHGGAAPDLRALARERGLALASADVPPHPRARAQAADVPGAVHVHGRDGAARCAARSSTIRVSSSNTTGWRPATEAGSRTGRTPYSTRPKLRITAGGNRYARSGHASWIACAARASSSWIFLWKTRNRAGGDPSPRRSSATTCRRWIPSWSPPNALCHGPCRRAPMYTARACTRW